MKSTVSTKKAAELRNLKIGVSKAHRRWIENNPTATLADLLSFLSAVQEDFEQFDEDDILADIVGELGEAGEYLAEFESFELPVCVGGGLPTVGYRATNVEEDISNVGELIELVGESFEVERLPITNRRAKG